MDERKLRSQQPGLLNEAVFNLTSALMWFVAFCLSAAVVAYLWITFGERGLVADATGTSGYTTPLEFALLLISVLAAPVFLSLFILSLARWIQVRWKI